MLLSGLGLSEHDRWTLATTYVQMGEHNRAADVLLDLVAGHDEQSGPVPVAVRELLARSLFAAARLRAAEEVLRALVVDRPSDAYAHLLLARTLERQHRRADAAPFAAIARALDPDLVRG